MTLNGYYLNPHQSQLGATIPIYTRHEGCTPTSGANGANASTGGKVAKTGPEVHALIPKAQETDPSVPGWSLVDLDHAMTKLGVPFDVRSGAGWSAAIAALDAGHYIALQGDSDQFSNNTCSGIFNGDHCIGIHPAAQGIGSSRQHWIDDPLCPGGRWEHDSVLHNYAEKFSSTIRFGVFTLAVPRPVPPVKPPVAHRVHIAEGAVIRSYHLSSTGCIQKEPNGRYGVSTRWTGNASSAPCTATTYRKTCDLKSHATTTHVTDGAFKGQTIRVGKAYGVTVS